MKFFDEDEIHELYIHLIWSTCRQAAIISPDVAKSLYNYIGDLALQNDCNLIGGKIFADHLQLIIKFHPNIILQNLITDIKVGSALWVTTNFSEMQDFAWQQSDFCFSVSPEEVGALINRIENSSLFINEISEIVSQNGLVFEPSEMFV